MATIASMMVELGLDPSGYTRGTRAAIAETQRFERAVTETSRQAAQLERSISTTPTM